MAKLSGIPSPTKPSQRPLLHPRPPSDNDELKKTQNSQRLNLNDIPSLSVRAGDIDIPIPHEEERCRESTTLNPTRGEQRRGEKEGEGEGEADERAKRRARLLALTARARTRTRGGGYGGWTATRLVSSSRSASSESGTGSDGGGDDDDDDEDDDDDDLAGFIVGDGDEDVSYVEESWLGGGASKTGSGARLGSVLSDEEGGEDEREKEKEKEKEKKRKQSRQRRLVRGRLPGFTSLTGSADRSVGRSAVKSVREKSKGQMRDERCSVRDQDDCDCDRTGSRGKRGLREIPQPTLRGERMVAKDSSSGKAPSYPTPPESSSGATSDHELSGDEVGNQDSTRQIYPLPDDTEPSSKLQSPSKSPSKQRQMNKRGPKIEKGAGAAREARPLDWLLNLDDLEAHFGSDLNDDSDDSDDCDGDLFKFALPKLSPVKKKKTPGKQATPQLPPAKSKRAEQAELRTAKKEKQAKKKAFNESKDALAREFLQTLDELVTNGEIQKLAASEGGVKIIWSKTLNKTAGRANWKRIVSRSGSGSTSTSSSSNSNSNSSSSRSSSSRGGSTSTTPEPPAHPQQSKPDHATTRHIASIELAEKVIDCEDRLYKTLAHEFCHLANFMVSHVVDNPHGESFRRWTSKCMAALADHSRYASFDVTITTRHSYEIDYKYVWSCEACGLEYGRHSRSIDPGKVRCGKCKTGRLVQVKPKPRSVSPKKKVPQQQQQQQQQQSVKSTLFEKGREGCNVEANSGPGSGSGPGSAIGNITNKLKVINLVD